MQVDKDFINDSEATRDVSPARSIHDDEEPVTSGWGDDDGMGF